jgi:hypothetical protein
MESSQASPVFISTEELEQLIKQDTKNLKVFDTTFNVTAEEGDPILLFNKAHIPT